MKTTIIAGLTLALASPLFAAGEGWISDFEAAKKQAAAENKDLLVDFTGSDWCGWCIKLNEEVFQHDPFNKGVADQFVLVELDFPRDKSKLSEDTIKQNNELKDTYQVKGFPTILLMDAKGLPYAQTGYQAGGPTQYVEHLNSLQSTRAKRDATLAESNNLDGVAKAKALVKALSAIPENQHHHYSELITQIETLDPKDETGFIAKQKKAAAKLKFKGDLNSALRSRNAEKASEIVDAYVTEHQLTGEEKQETLFMKVNAHLMTQDFDAADQLVAEVIAIEPNSKFANYVEGLKPRLESMRAKAAEAEKKDQ